MSYGNPQSMVARELEIATDDACDLIKELEEKVTDLEAEVEDLKGQVEGAEEDIRVLESDLDKAKNE